MKRLHRMILGAYIGPLLITFIIVLFLFSMQWLWKWVDELMGKGLPWDVLTRLIAYATSAFVPAVLPLAVLLSSIMTMGGLAERSELTPMRSAGLGLFKIITPLVVFVLGLAAFSFYFSNNVLPVANLKFQSLLWDVTRAKPALNLQPGVFFGGLDGFSIRVGAKDEDSGELHDVLIYDHRDPFQANRTVVRAEKGTMRRSTDSRYLVLVLENGSIHDERGAGPTPMSGELPQLRGRFLQDEIRIDLSGMRMKRTDEELFKDHYKMLTLGQLAYAEDSLAQRLHARMDEQERSLRNSLFILREKPSDSIHPAVPSPVAGLSTGGLERHAPWHPMASDLAREAINQLDRLVQERKDRTAQIAKFQVEWHRKLMLAFACVVFFFIGAPLGAIVGKGGMGLPAVIAILFFLVFHILSYSTEQMVKAGTLGPWPGMWISTFVLLPIGMFLTWKAAVESPLFDRVAYDRAWKRFRSLLAPRHAHPPTVQ